MHEFKTLIQRKALAVLLWTNALVLVAAAMLGPIYALVVGKVGGDPLEAGYAFAAYAFTAGIVTLVAGHFSDHHSRHAQVILMLGYACMGAGFLLYIVTYSLPMLIFVQMLIGFGEAIHAPAFDKLLTQQADGKQTFGRVWGMWEASNHFTAAIGASLGAVIAAHFGFIPLFATMAVLCFLSVSYLWVLPDHLLEH